MNRFEFHPAVARWFEQTFGSPTEPQILGWPEIQSGRHVLISAPTGSGKTLAAFLASLDQLFREGVNRELPDETQIVYVSPLKALSNDIRKNLQEPLAGIRELLKQEDHNVDHNGKPNCAIIDIGHHRELDLAIEIPKSALEAVMSNEIWEEVYSRLAELIQEHRTTLVFVNTRRMAERVTHHLSELLGADAVTSHHGSLSAKLRLDAEDRLKRGDLKALVATASLELGIDIGSVDFVCPPRTPRSNPPLLQPVGRPQTRAGGLAKRRS